MSLKQLSRLSNACFAALIVIGGCSFQAQASTQKERFLASYVVVLKQEPRLAGDQKALGLFILGEEKHWNGLYEMGKSACDGLRAGIPAERVRALLQEGMSRTPSQYYNENRDMFWSINVATVSAAKATICP